MPQALAVLSSETKKEGRLGQGLACPSPTQQSVPPHTHTHHSSNVKDQTEWPPGGRTGSATREGWKETTWHTHPPPLEEGRQQWWLDSPTALQDSGSARQGSGSLNLQTRMFVWRSGDYAVH